jgi:hypothetical protein
VFARRRGACGVGGGVLDLVDGLEISLCTTRDGWCCQWLLQVNVRAGRLRGCSLDAVVLMAAFWYTGGQVISLCKSTMPHTDDGTLHGRRGQCSIRL